MDGLYKNGCSDPEFLWVQITEEAVVEFDSGRFTAAAERWQKAYSVAKDFGDRDPRLAGSLSNLAITFRINHDFDEAERLYQSALEKWASASHWVDRMQLEPRARSSLFHLRLERKHRKKYDDIARRKYLELLPAGHAATLNNLAELLHSTHRVQDTEQLYDQALRERMRSMNEQEPGVAIIHGNLANLSDVAVKQPDQTFSPPHKASETAAFISQAARYGWIVDKPAEFTDEGRLMVAILLTHLIDHTRLSTANL